MLREIILHELQHILLSKKFIIAFALLSGLMLLSVALGINNYRMQMQSYNTLQNLNEQEMREQKNWRSFSAKAIRKPEPIQIFSAGVNYDIGRYAVLSSYQQSDANHSVYADDPFFAVFRYLDFSFIAVFVLSLFILVFTYDAVNGEAENGTLKLIFSNAVKRSTYLTGKIAGICGGILLPLLIPLLLSLALLLLSGVPLSGSDVAALAVLFGLVLLLGLFFVLLGILLSVSIRRASVSFLAALACWVLFTCLIPRGGILLAGQLVYVPGIEELKGEQEQFEKQCWAENLTAMQNRWKEREIPMQSLSPAEREAYRDRNMWAWMEADETERKQAEKKINEHYNLLQERLRNNKRELENLALKLACVSPVAAFQLAVMEVSGTDIGLKNRFDDMLAEYRKTFLAYKAVKEKEAGNPGGIRITFDSDTGLKIDASRTSGTLDVSGVPRFQGVVTKNPHAHAAILGNTGIILIVTMLMFGAAFAGFLRMDVR